MSHRESQANHVERWPRYHDLRDKTVVVTGGSRGLGAETCRAFAANGARVAVNGRDEAAISRIVAELKDIGAEAIGVAADCTSPDEVRRLHDQTTAELGSPDVLIGFAGAGRPPAPLASIDVAEWKSDIDANLTATFLTVRQFLGGMCERGHGAIVTMASAAARLAGGAPIAYAAAKSGIVSLTRQAAFEAGPAGVRVNCLAPSTVVNERMDRLLPAAQRAELASRYPLRRLGEPADVANAALFLASDASSWITGITLDVAGGQIMR